MKINVTKRVWALLLTLAMLIPCFAGITLPAKAAETTYGTETVYDIYDLNGSKTNTINGTGNGNWSATVLGNVDVADKENVSFKANVNITDGNEHRFSLGALDSMDCVDVYSYGLVLHFALSKVVFYCNNQWIASWDMNNADWMGEYELEFGYRNILDGNLIVGKQLFVKKNGEVLHTYDHMSGYLTGDALGTKVALFHYGSVVQMDTTYTTTYGTERVYDIFDLTGSQTNTLKGTDETWAGQIHANVSAEHKENFAFKTKLTMGAQEVRLSLTAKDGDSIFDPPGYAVYLYGAYNKIEIRRNNTCLKSVEGVTLTDTCVFEVGIVDILFAGERQGKHIYVKINDVVVAEYDDVSGYLTGDALGTKIVDFHYGAAIQMDTTYDDEVTLVNAEVYDIYDLTGDIKKEVAPWQNDNWEGQKIGSVSAEHKEQAAIQFNMNITNAKHRYRFSVGALEGENCIETQGYGLEIAVQLDGSNHISFLRNGSWIASTDDVSGVIGEHDYEFGYRSIKLGENIIGKQIYLSVDGVDLLVHYDLSGYLTGDALGTMVALHHIDDAAALLKTCELSYGTAVNIYDVAALTGSETNTIQGTGNHTWSATVLGNVEAADKENVIFRANVNIEDDLTKYNNGTEIRLSLGALESDDVVDTRGYGLILHFGMSKLIFARAGSWIVSWDINNADWMGEYSLVFGYRDILCYNNRVGKQILVMKDGELVYTYDDFSGYLTGDTLGTKVGLFHYSPVVEMNTVTVDPNSCEHKYTTVTIDPDCETEGQKIYTCSICNYYYVETIPALGHNQVAERVDATCTVIGLTSGTRCTRCNEVFDAQAVIPAKGHTEVIDAAVAPTCTATGLTEGKHCSACNTVIVAQQTVAATGHSYNAVVTDPDCTNKGYTTYTCTACGDTYTDNEVAANGHSYNAVVTAPTCTAQGYTTHTCSVCGDSYVDSYVDAKGHSYNSGVITTAPGCTTEGVKTYTCTVCGHSYTEPVDATGHSYNAVVTDPDCTNKGYTTYTCTACGDTYTDNEVAANGHSYNAVVTAPTCTAQGYTTYTCSVCGHSYVDNYVAATGHTEVVDAAVAATCTATGLTEGKHCSVCNEVLVAQQETAALGHTEVVDAAVAATCTATGLTEGSHCSVCNEVLVEQETVDALGHSYTAAIDTTTDIPTITYTCSCGDVQKAELRFTGASLTLENNIVVNFKTVAGVAGTEQCPGFTNLRAVFTYGERKDLTGENAITAEGVDLGNGRYNLACRRVTPSQIGDEITAILYGTYDGVEYSYEMKYSAAQYCYAALKDTNDTKLQTLLVNLLYYCDAARAYTTYQGVDENYKYYGSVTEDLTEEQKAYRTVANEFTSVMDQTANEGATATWQSASLIIGDTTSIQFRVDMGGTVLTQDMIQVTVGVNKSYSDVRFMQDGDTWLIRVDGLAAHQMSDTVSVTLSSNGTPISNTVSYSIESYAARNMENSNTKLVDMLVAMMNYGDAAVAYKG